MKARPDKKISKIFVGVTVQLDLNSEHLISRNMCRANFYLFVIQMVCYSDARHHVTGIGILVLNKGTSGFTPNTLLIPKQDLLMVILMIIILFHQDS